MSPLSPLLTQKNNLMMPACQVGSLHKASIYGSPRVTSGKPPVCSIPLVAQYRPPPPHVATTLQSENQTYGLLLPSKSYDELHNCSSSMKPCTLNRLPQQGVKPITCRPTPVMVRKQQDGYQTPLTQASISDEYTPISLAPMTSVAAVCNDRSLVATPFCAVPSSPQRSPSSSTNDPRAFGQASFV